MFGHSIFYKGFVFGFPFIAIVLVQFIQGFESWNTHQVELPNYYDFNSDHEINHNSEQSSRGDSKNISVRDDYYDDTSKKISLPSIPNKFSGVIAYHRTLHNVSWAITIPLFSFLLPIADSGHPTSLPNQALYGFFAAVIVIIGFAIPILFNGVVPGARSLGNNKITLSHLMHPGHLVNLVGVSMQNQVGIDPMECLQKSVCEAYRSPQNKRYGALALPFQYFFPAKNETETSINNIYQIAAREGKFTKTDCRKKYDCIFDVLELASYLLSVYKRTKSNSRLEEE